MAKQRYKATRLNDGKKKLALSLAASMVVLIAIYFGCIKAYIAVIQQIYIWGALIIGVAYMFVAGFIAGIKQKGGGEQQKKLARLDTLRKALLIVVIPMIFALLIDYMLLYLGLAGYFGI